MRRVSDLTVEQSKATGPPLSASLALTAPIGGRDVDVRDRPTETKRVFRPLIFRLPPEASSYG